MEGEKNLGGRRSRGEGGTGSGGGTTAPARVAVAANRTPRGSATQHGAGCGVQVVKGVGAGVAGAGCDGAESAADAVSAAPPSGTCGGGAWPWLWAAHPREAMVERCPRAIVVTLRPIVVTLQHMWWSLHCT